MSYLIAFAAVAGSVTVLIQCASASAHVMVGVVSDSRSLFHSSSAMCTHTAVGKQITNAAAGCDPDAELACLRGLCCNVVSSCWAACFFGLSAAKSLVDMA